MKPALVGGGAWWVEKRGTWHRTGTTVVKPKIRQKYTNKIVF